MPFAPLCPLVESRSCVLLLPVLLASRPRSQCPEAHALFSSTSLMLLGLGYFNLLFLAAPCHLACRISVPWRAVEQGPRQWQPGILPTRPLGSFPVLRVRCSDVKYIHSVVQASSLFPKCFLQPKQKICNHLVITIHCSLLLAPSNLWSTVCPCKLACSGYFM